MNSRFGKVIRKMKIYGLLLILTALLQGSISVIRERQVADHITLLRQKNILSLLRYVYQPKVIPEIAEVSQSYNIEENVSNYRVPSLVTKFVRLYKSGLLPRDGVFSILDDKQRREAIALFELLYFAKDYDTFYKTACWARVNVHPGQFVYVLAAALSHREDTRNIVLPSLNEITPHFFIDSEVIQRASEMVWNNVEATEFTLKGNTSECVKGVYPSNSYLRMENRMLYFTEDVTLNTYNNFYHINNPFWLNVTEGKRGELFWYYHQQLLSRYILERYSNDLPSFEPLAMDKLIKVGYNSRLRYPNGRHFSNRPDNIELDAAQMNQVKLLEDFDRRIRDAIDLGYVFTENGERVSIYDSRGMDNLGHLIQATQKSMNKRFYGNIYQLTMKILGRCVDPHHSHRVPPSVLEHFETSLRDPLYYRAVSTMLRLFSRYKSHLPSYKKEELEFPGVKIDNVRVDTLTTFFEDYDFDISNGIHQQFEKEVPIRVSNLRLNHSPFSYYINVTAEKPCHGMVRIFIGLAYDTEDRTLNINEKRKHMVQIDNFPIELQAGKNRIERKSEDNSIIRRKFPAMRQMEEEVKNALHGTGKYYLDVVNEQCGYPEHLLIPKGKANGLPYTFFVVISKYNPKDFENTQYGCGNGRGLFYEDQHSMGYPFDRIIDEEEFGVHNFHEKKIFIYHVERSIVEEVITAA